LGAFKNQDLEIFLLIIVIAIISIPVISLHADVALNNSINISNDPSFDSSEPQVTAAGNNVYVVWVNQTGFDPFRVEMKASTDSGVSFASVINLREGGEFDEIFTPVINASGSKLYVAYEELIDSCGAFGGSDIFFTNTTNNGATTFTPINISNDCADDDSTLQQLATVDSNVYIVWDSFGDEEILFANSTDDGVTFDSDAGVGFNLSNDADDSSIPQIAASANNVHVVWYGDTGSSTSTISIRSSTNGASSFNSVKSLDTLATGLSSSLDIDVVASGDNVFVVWEDGNEIMFINSTDAGATFDSGGPFNLSNSGSGTASEHPRVSISGSNVYVTWEENTEIYLRASTNLGSSFNSFVNLSADSGNSDLPEIASTGNDVYVVWANFNSLTNSDDIFQRHSPDSGSTFCGIAKITSDTVASTVPLISLSGSNVYTIWNNFTSTNIFDIGFRAGTTASTCVQFNATQYRTTDSAFITVDDPDSVGAGTLSVTISSFDINNNPTTINVNLIETGSTGTFTGTITFIDSGSSSGSTLLVGPDKTVTLNAATTSIFPRSVSFLLTAGGSDTNSYTLSSKAFLQVTDQNSNLTAAVETITTSVSSPFGSITLDLVETGPKTGIFAKDRFGFNEAFSGEIPIDGTITLSQSDPDPTPRTYSSTAIDKIDITLISDSEPTGVALSLIETGVDTRDFQRTMSFSTTASVVNSTLKASPNDFIEFTIFSEAARGIISPITNSSRGSLQAVIGDTITATFQGISDTVEIKIGGSGGGGGGGVVRPGLVLNVVAGITAAFGGGTDGSPPITSLGNLITNKNFDVPDEIVKIVENYDPVIPLEPISTSKFADFDLPFTINESGYPLGGYSNTIQTFSTDIGEPITITSLYYEQTALQHVSMYLNLRGIITGDLSKSDTQILYNKDKPLQVIDPNGFFENVSVNIIDDEDGVKKFATFEIIFAKPMETSDIVLRSWDDKLRSMDTIIYAAIEIIDPQNTSIFDNTLEPETEEVISTDTDVQKVPEWIKNTAEWWSQGEVDETTFKNAIQFLIQENIIDVPTEANVSVSKDDQLAQEELQLDPEPIPIPQWIKNTAEWWSQGVITEDDFLQAVEYLIKNGIIQI